MARAVLTLHEYYQDAAVRARLLEFLGGRRLEEVTAEYITAEGRESDVRFEPRPTALLWRCLDAECDLGRSLWDRRSLLAHLDVEYVNFDFPGEAYLEPARTFDVQRPVAHAIRAILRQFGIDPLHLISGRGHHFVWRINRCAKSFVQLAGLGRLPEPVAACNRQPHPQHQHAVDDPLGAAFAGLGQVMEYLAQQVLDQARPHCRIPIELTAVQVGPGERGREIVSLDVSEYGDPLHTRGIRVPFSVYLKQFQQQDQLGRHVAEAVPFLFVIPVTGISDQEGLCIMRQAEAARELAQSAVTAIPDCSTAMQNLIAAYAGSPLARFHQAFYAVDHDPPAQWPRSYDSTSWQGLPPCARAVLEQPNERLLKPAGIQHVVRVLLSQGWHPRHIAGLIRSRYERDYGWGAKWYHYNACLRADFFTRIFAGLIATGRDSLIDFNCRSTQEKGCCPVNQCHENLLSYRSLLQQVSTNGAAWTVQKRTDMTHAALTVSNNCLRSTRPKGFRAVASLPNAAAPA